MERIKRKVVGKLKKEFEETKIAFRTKITTLLLGGFGLVAALAWNEVIKTFFDTYFKQSNGLVGKFIYAITVTIIIVFVSKYLEKLSQTEQK